MIDVGLIVEMKCKICIIRPIHFLKLFGLNTYFSGVPSRGFVYNMLDPLVFLTSEVEPRVAVKPKLIHVLLVD